MPDNPQTSEDVREGYWSKVDRGRADECWPWLGSRQRLGYGTYSNRRATHIALELDGRPRPGQLLALHSCDNPPCVNPRHLRWGTHADNMADMLNRQRHYGQQIEQCPQGHPLSGTNLRARANGQRGCRQCGIDQVRRARVAVKAGRLAALKVQRRVSMNPFKLTEAQQRMLIEIGDGQPVEYALGPIGFALVRRKLVFVNELGARHLTDAGHKFRNALTEQGASA